YTAVRVVRRTGQSGATTREARLEKGGEVLAGNADELTAAVERLLGLRFHHFLKCVVLPQGEFAQFLRDKPKDRQNLLVELLDIGIYREMAQRAGARHRTSEQEAAWIRDRLEKEYGHATPRSCKEAKKRARQLEALYAKVRKAQPRMVKLAETIDHARRASDEIATRVRALEALRIPDGLAEWADRREAAANRARQARRRLEKSSKEVERWEKALRRLPDRFELKQVQADHLHRLQLTLDLSTKNADLGKARAAEDQARQQHEEAAGALKAARHARNGIRDAHAAAHLAGQLQKGERCPVCTRPVTRVPKVKKPPDLASAEEGVRTAEEAHRQAYDTWSQAQGERKRLQGGLERDRQNLRQLESKLKEKPSEKQVALLLEEIEKMEAGRKEARRQEQEARKDHDTARSLMSGLEEEKAKGFERFHQARDPLAPLKPPPIRGQEELDEAWTALLGWAQSEISVQKEKAAGYESKAGTALAKKELLETELREACQNKGLHLEGRAPEAACIAEWTAARKEHEALEEALRKADQLKAEVQQLDQQSRVAKDLARLLGSTGFERWYLNRAMKQLAAGASRILRELSTGQYSLTLDKAGRDFLVVDHNNADELRLARTLSGGETFLASFSLALALSEYVAQLAASGAARLDAIFLDEGFGALDPDTLDTVAAAIENLGAQGRMVGLITHVRELAERIPVRYQVSKAAGTSRVERVVA
ncbi:MAG: SbcC/MukB-like Walker B domain-containing protein, partial [Acidobacteriota bacterium]